MHWWFYFTPLIGAILGWWLVALLISMLFHPQLPRTIAGIKFQGIIPKKLPALAVSAGRLSASLLPVNEIEQNITNPENVKKIMPQAEAHIDHFLRIKLVKSMPMVGMFVGDKTINNLKGLFMTELEELFPEIMKNYMGRLQEDLNIEHMVTTKIAAIDPATLENAFLNGMQHEIRMLKWLGATLGFVIGLVQLLVFLFLPH
ncbi:MAG: DUF445 domain-containing protein [Chitinophagaceae bacterium]